MHQPVMVDEVVRYLVTRTDGVYVDCTVGGGGHARRILLNAPAGRLLGIDLDPSALEEAGRTLGSFAGRCELVHGNFGDLDVLAPEHGVDSADGVLFDLGFSSLQLDDPRRGFSYSTTGPIDMRLDPGEGTPASALISRMRERDLSRLLAEYGEERRSHPIARAIIEARDHGRLETTADLAEDALPRLPGDQDRRQRRTPELEERPRGSDAPALARRTARRHLVPLPRGQDCEAGVRDGGASVHVPARPARMRVREEAHPQDSHQARRAPRRRRGRPEPAREVRQAPGRGEARAGGGTVKRSGLLRRLVVAATSSLHTRGLILWAAALATGIVCVWEHAYSSDLAKEIQSLRNRREDLIAEIGFLRMECAQLGSRERIETEAGARLGLRYPRDGEVIWLTGDGERVPVWTRDDYVEGNRPGGVDG
jgi:cell division protein FtsL